MLIDKQISKRERDKKKEKLLKKKLSKWLLIRDAERKEEVEPKDL